jgi:hypothetical protein
MVLVIENVLHEQEINDILRNEIVIENSFGNEEIKEFFCKKKIKSSLIIST